VTGRSDPSPSWVSSPTVGYIGLGNIGEPIATRILKAGFRTVVWNRTATKSLPLADQGAAIASSPADLASRCQVVCVCLSNAEAVEVVVFGPEGLAARPGSLRVLIDNSTIHPDKTRQFAERLRQAIGAGWLDCPVSGGPVGARAGTLAAMVGGEGEEFQLARPVIESFAAKITHMGPVGCGQVAKACNQVIGFGAMAAIAEALVLAQRSGIAMDRLPDALAGGFADSNVLKEYARATSAGEAGGIAVLVRALIESREGRAGDRYGNRFALLLKDIAIASDLGRSTGTATPMAALIEELYRQAGNYTHS
jgi:3-hydroxyisobutyrate dehydrogenase-like beta-hydroxyacid dehydrogenase